MFKNANRISLSALLLLSLCNVSVCAAEWYNITWYHPVSYDHWRGVRDLKIVNGEVTFTDPATNRKVTIPSTYATPVSQEVDGSGNQEVRFYKPSGSYLQWRGYKDLKIDATEYRFNDCNGKKVIILGTIVVEEY